jgi:hypothetical protein
MRRDILAHRGTQADGKTVPAIDRDDRERQGDDLLLIELRYEDLVDIVRCARLAPGS